MSQKILSAKHRGNLKHSPARWRCTAPLSQCAPPQRSSNTWRGLASTATDSPALSTVTGTAPPLHRLASRGSRLQFHRSRTTLRNQATATDVGVPPLLPCRRAVLRCSGHSTPPQSHQGLDLLSGSCHRISHNKLFPPYFSKEHRRTGRLEQAPPTVRPQGTTSLPLHLCSAARATANSSLKLPGGGRGSRSSLGEVSAQAGVTTLFSKAASSGKGLGFRAP
ncbi:uncharacterized protein LOC125293364 [Alosa alosa]|uniref:uncharacterized protein LOC125293364 n=1 Tax=Alosa alosa TaxID=278164 RepID=UPI0020152805|nr:uncharacterized protein LOC125293364 [Alosa alosa]